MMWLLPLCLAGLLDTLYTGEAPKPMLPKPRIWPVHRDLRHGGWFWACALDGWHGQAGGCLGYGNSPTAAYEEWRREMPPLA